MEIPKIWIWSRKKTWKECYKLIKNALEIWYKHIDTAQIYNNEEEVGKAINDFWINRENLFITTKIRIDNYWYEQTLFSVEKSLEKLQTDYIDLLLMHWPTNQEEHKQTLKAMTKLKNEWKVQKIGVSNFNIKQLEKAIEYTNNQIYTNQIEHHVYLGQQKMQNFCSKNKIKITAYSPLWHWHILKDKTLEKIAQKHWKTISQIALKRLSQVHKNIIIPKSSDPKHLKENLNIQNFKLDQKDIEEIQKLPKTYRYINPPFAPEWDKN